MHGALRHRKWVRPYATMHSAARSLTCRSGRSMLPGRSAARFSAERPLQTDAKLASPWRRALLLQCATWKALRLPSARPRPRSSGDRCPDSSSSTSGRRPHRVSRLTACGIRSPSPPWWLACRSWARCAADRARCGPGPVRRGPDRGGRPAACQSRPGASAHELQPVVRASCRPSHSVAVFPGTGHRGCRRQQDRDGRQSRHGGSQRTGDATTRQVRPVNSPLVRATKDRSADA